MTPVPNPLHTNNSDFVPALRFKWATKLYDGVMQHFVREERLRQLTVQAINPQPGEAILDFGCGTGSLTQALNWSLPSASTPLRLSAYDIDPEIIDIAKAKLEGGSVGAVPDFYQVDITDSNSIAEGEAGKYDVVASSLVFHHLTHDQKTAAFDHARKLLKPSGRLVLVDWGPGSTPFFKAAFWMVRIFDGLAVTRDNANGRLPAMMASAGLKVTKQNPLLNTVYGTVWLYEATREGE